MATGTTDTRALRRAFIARMVGAMTDVAESLDAATLEEAVNEPADLSALVHALHAALPRTESDGKSNALDRARLRGVAARARLIEEEGGTMSSTEVARHLGLTPQAVNDRRKAGKLLAVEAGRRGYRYPVWQFVPEGTQPGLEDVLSQLRVLSPWTRLSFMLNPNDSLGGRSPLSSLRDGQRDRVVEAAARYGEQGP